MPNKVTRLMQQVAELQLELETTKATLEITEAERAALSTVCEEISEGEVNGFKSWYAMLRLAEKQQLRAEKAERERDEALIELELAEWNDMASLIALGNMTPIIRETRMQLRSAIRAIEVLSVTEVHSQLPDSYRYVEGRRLGELIRLAEVFLDKDAVLDLTSVMQDLLRRRTYMGFIKAEDGYLGVYREHEQKLQKEDA